jgi:uncharacterized protein
MFAELLIGIAAGALSAMTGIGGAVIAIPLLLAAGTGAHAAVGLAILMVVVAAANGAYSYSTRGLVDWHAAFQVGIPGMATAVIGAWVSARVPAPVLVYAVAGVVLFFGAFILLSKPVESEKKSLRKSHAALLGAAVGFVSGLTGIGGGAILASSYAGLLGFAAHSAIATAHATMLLFALPGAAAHIALGSTDAAAAVPLLFGALAGSRLGVRMALRTDEARLRKGMAVLFVLIGLWLAISQYLKAG